MRKPAAAEVMDAWPWWAPIWLMRWLFTWCVRCDRVVTRWHYGKCPCAVIVIKDSDRSPFAEAIRRPAGGAL